MHNMRLWSAAVIIAAILIVGFVLSVPQVRDLGSKPTAETASSTPIVYVHDSYKKGTYTITAEIPLPDACTSVAGQVSVTPASASNTPDAIELAFDMPPDTGICLQEPATTTLSFTASASANAVITASINGNNASTTSY
jgi:hypothetical protein